MSVPVVHLTIDGRPVAVPKGTTIWQAARQVGVEIPVFCYHDRMPPLGACRMCLVEVEKMPKLVTSCTQEAGEEMVVHTQSERVKEAQRGILEFLLANHPLDCPICDKGGECPLQDNTLKFGPGSSRFVEVKRSYGKHIRMGPVLVLDRERCILCWRCVRFGELVAGDDALKGFERGYHSQVATPFLEPVRSKFIGNTIEICPVGALTSATYRFRARPWDTRRVPSVCPHCGCGCATLLEVRDNQVARTRPREQPEVNDVWLCDKGFFGYEFVGSPERLRVPLVRDGGSLREASWEEALDRVVTALRAGPPEAVGVVGGARCTNEEAYLLGRVFRTVVGTNHIDFRTDTAHPLPVAEAPWGLDVALADVERADGILLVGCDLTEEYPILWLRVKKAVDRGARLLIVNPWEPEIARWAAAVLVHRHGAQSALLSALAGAGPADRAAAISGVETPAVEAARGLLAESRRPLVLLGRTALEGPGVGDVLAAVDLLRAVRPETGVGLLRGRGNSVGAQLLGLVPEMLPGYRPLADVQSRRLAEEVWGRPIPPTPGRTVRGMLEAARSGSLRVLYVVGADPATEYPDRRAWEEARPRLQCLIVHELFLTPTAAEADIVLPVLAYAEKTGTVTNIEGRVQRQEAAVLGPGEARADGDIVLQVAARLGVPLEVSSWAEVFGEIGRLIPGWAEDARLPAPRPPARELARGVRGDPPGESCLDGGDLRLVVGSRLFDRGTAAVRCPGIRDQAGEPFVALHPEDAAPRGVGEGTLCEVRSPRGVLRLRARLWPGLCPGHAYVPRGYDTAPVSRLLDEERPVAVSIRRVGP